MKPALQHPEVAKFAGQEAEKPLRQQRSAFFVWKGGAGALLWLGGKRYGSFQKGDPKTNTWCPQAPLPSCMTAKLSSSSSEATYMVVVFPAPLWPSNEVMFPS